MTEDCNNKNNGKAIAGNISKQLLTTQKICTVNRLPVDREGVLLCN
jgi:hypothetical protein